MNENFLNLTLTEKEYSSILEALLFSCSVDALSDWDYDDIINLKDILIKMRIQNQNIPTKRISVIKNIDEKYEYNDLHTEELVKYFPEIIMKEQFV
jgi:hypothetical protein